MSLTTKVKVAKFSFLNEKSYNKTVINFNFGRHKDLSTLKSDIHLGLAASVNYHLNPYVYLIEVNNCIISVVHLMRNADARTVRSRQATFNSNGRQEA